MMTRSPGRKAGASIWVHQARKACFTVHRSIEQHGGYEAGHGQGADEGDGLPVTVRDGGPTALSSSRPTAQAGHLGRQPAFIDEDQTRGIELGLAIGPSLAGRLYVRTLLLTGVGSLFLCVWP